MRYRLHSPEPRIACETERKLGVDHYLSLVALLACLFTVPVAPVRAAQPEPATATNQPAATAVRGGAAPVDQVRGEGTPGVKNDGGGGGAISVIARVVNCGIVAGTLVYLLRTPLANYLRDRSTQIRSDLVNAAEMKKSAAAEIQEIDRKMKALPGELEALRAQGAREIAAEEERIRQAAAAERDRLLDQTRREIDLQVKVAERELVNHAAELAVSVARERIKKNITDDDQKRLVDRYVSQLKS
jgi:F-type H+-transporting ATPase subunit b